MFYTYTSIKYSKHSYVYYIVIFSIMLLYVKQKTKLSYVSYSKK